jgi:arylsulfatase
MADSRPNILLIMTDQQRGDCLGIAGHPGLLTPNMDHLAASGVRFTRGYSTCPSCVPARRSLMSGQHPASTGMVGYRDGVEWEKPPPLLPQVLRDAGYQTALVGRSMHLSPPRKRYGYEQVIHTSHSDPDNDYNQFLRRHGIDPHDGAYGTGVMHNDFTARPWHLEERLHPTHWTVTEALKWLDRRDPTAPFFLTVSFLAPHPPLNPPAAYFERYLRMDLPEPVIGDWATPPENDGLGLDVSSPKVHLRDEMLRSAMAGYFGLINHIDDQMRRLLNGVTGVDRLTGGNTIIVFTSDHGEMLGDHYGWRKSVPYEGSANIPLLIRPARGSGFGSGVVRDEPVCLEDIMPTLLDMAGLPIPDSVDGRSLVQLMHNQDVPWREHLHIEHAPQHHTLTDGRQKFIWWVADGREQFFDLTADPRECRDLIADPAVEPCIERWRAALIEELAGRPEGFSDGQRLIPGVRYPATLNHVAASPAAARWPDRGALPSQPTLA